MAGQGPRWEVLTEGSAIKAVCPGAHPQALHCSQFTATSNLKTSSQAIIPTFSHIYIIEFGLARPRLSGTPRQVDIVKERINVVRSSGWVSLNSYNGLGRSSFLFLGVMGFDNLVLIIIRLKFNLDLSLMMIVPWRDDLESLAYILLYLLSKNLPWHELCRAGTF